MCLYQSLLASIAFFYPPKRLAIPEKIDFTTLTVPTTTAVATPATTPAAALSATPVTTVATIAT